MSNHKSFTKVLPYNGVKIRVKVRDGSESVVMVRDRKDVATGRPVDPEACMNANCAMRHAGDGTFPHPVHAAWFIKSMAYILTSDKPSRGLYQAVRYVHRNWSDVWTHDKAKDATERLKMFAGEKKIHLYAVKGSSRIGNKPPHPHGRANKSGKPTGRVGVPRGMNARFITLKQYRDTEEKRAALS